MKRLKKWWWLILIIIIFAFIVYWTWFRPNKNKQETYNVTKGDIVSTLVLAGEINANQKASVRFQSSGLVSWVGVKTGDVVKKGQSLASLDRRALKKSLEQKLNAYMATRWNFEQTAKDNENWETRGMSDEERDGIRRIVDKSQFTLNNSVLDVELSDLSYQLASVSTPIEGIVVDANPEFSGVNVNPTNSGFEIVNPNTWYFSVIADQTEVVNLKNYQPVEIILDAFPDQKFEGNIQLISLIPDTTRSGTVYPVRVTSDKLKDQNGIRIGMTGDATFIIGESKATLQIPAKFYRQDANGIYVFTNNGKDKKYIELGLESGEMVEVIKGISEQEVIYLPQ